MMRHISMHWQDRQLLSSLLLNVVQCLGKRLYEFVNSYHGCYSTFVFQGFHLGAHAGVNSYHGCYSTSEYAYSYLSGLWSTPIIVVTQSVIEQTNKELKSYWSTPITVVTQPGLHPGIERQCLGVNSYHSCYSTMIQRAHANGLPFVNSYHSCYSTMPYWPS